MTIVTELSEQLKAELEILQMTGHYTSTSEFLKGDCIKKVIHQ